MKKALSLLLAIVMVIGALPALGLFTAADVETSAQMKVFTNVALGKSVTLGEGSIGDPAAVTDGSYGGYRPEIDFAASGLANPQCFATVDLGEVYSVDSVRVANYTDAGRYYKYEIYASADGSAWTKVAEKASAAPSYEGGYLFSFDAVNARYVKVQGTYHSANGAFHFVEIEVYSPDAYTLTEESYDCFFVSDGIRAVLSPEGVLTVSGTGALGSAGSTAADYPYDEVRGFIRKVIVEDGITSIGSFAFANCPALTSVEIKGEVTFGDNVFASSRVTNFSCNKIYYTDLFIDAGDTSNENLFRFALADTFGGAQYKLLNNGKTLYIYGCGEMPAYTKRDAVPWFTGTDGSFTKAIVGDGLTSLGNYALSADKYGSLSEIVLGASVERFTYQSMAYIPLASLTFLAPIGYYGHYTTTYNKYAGTLEVTLASGQSADDLISKQDGYPGSGTAGNEKLHDANFTSVNKFHVKYVDERSGDVLFASYVAEGQTPVYAGETPDAYTVNGVTYAPVIPAAEPASADAVYTVTYKEATGMVYADAGYKDPLPGGKLAIKKIIGGKDGKDYTPRLTDGVVSTGNYVDISFSNNNARANEWKGYEGDCYIEIDLGELCTVSSISLGNYLSSGNSRFYLWKAYGSADNTTPDIANNWTLLGEKMDARFEYYNTYFRFVKTDDTVLAKDGLYTSPNRYNPETPVRYIRIYGVFHSDNGGYHFSEVEVYGRPVKEHVTNGYGSNGMENWSGAFQLLLGGEADDGISADTINALYASKGDYDWTLFVSDDAQGANVKSYNVTPASKIDSTRFRFRTVNDNADPFVPVRGKTYFVDLQVSSKTSGDSAVNYFFKSREQGYTMPDDPIAYASLTLSSAYGGIENYDGHTYLLVNMTSDGKNDALYARLADGSYKLSAVIEDTQAGTKFYVEDYEGDNNFLYSPAFIRIDLPKYGVVPTAATTYAVTVYVTDAEGDLLYKGSTTADISSTNTDGFLANGAITYSPAPYAAVDITAGYTLDSGILTIYGDVLYSAEADYPWNASKDSVTKVVVKKTVTTVGTYACHDFMALDEVVIECGVSHLNGGAFSSVGNKTNPLRIVRLPKYMPSMDQGAFYFDQKVDAVFIRSSYSDFKAACDRAAYNYTAGFNTGLGNGNSTVLNVKDGVMTVYKVGSRYTSATAGNDLYWTNAPYRPSEAITTVIIDHDTHFGTTIPAQYLRSFSTQNVIIKEGITAIGVCAFAENANLINIEYPASLTSIGNSPLFNSPAHTVVFGGSYEDVLALTSGTNGRAQGMATAAWLHAENGTVTVYKQAGFSWATSTDSYLSQHRYEIGKVVFNNATLSNVTLNTVSHYFLYDLRALREVEIPDTITAIGREAFRFTAIEEITLPASVTSIYSNSPFYKNCTLKSVTIKNATVTANEFVSCMQLRDVTITGTPNIPDNAFNTTPALTNLYACHDKSELTIGETGNDTLIAANFFTHGDEGFIYDERTVVAPTCTEAGYTNCVCSLCGNVKQIDAVAATGHAFGKWETTLEPTCGEAGSQTRACLICGEEETQTLNATGAHTYGDWFLDSKPTFTQPGTLKHVCTVCEAFETDEVPASVLDVNDEVIVGKKDGKNTAAVVGTIVGEDLDMECVDKLTVTLTFKQGETVVKAASPVTVKNLYKTVTGVASTSASTAASQGIAFIEATYLFSVRVSGIPAGSYTVDVQLDAVLGDQAVVTVNKTLSFEVSA